MSDILLTVGLQTGAADISKVREDIDKIFSEIDKNPPKIKVGVEVSQTSLNAFKKQLSGILRGLTLGDGSKPTSIKVDGIGEITAEADKAKKSLDGAARSAQKLKSAVSKPRSSKKTDGSVSEVGSKSYNDALTKTNSLLAQLRKNYKEFSDIGDKSAKPQYTELGSVISDLETFKATLESGGMVNESFANGFSEIKARASEATTELKRFQKVAVKKLDGVLTPESQVKTPVVSKQKSSGVLAIGSKEYNNALDRSNKLLQSLNKEYRGFMDIGSGKQSFKNLESSIGDLSNLRTSLMSGSMSAEDFATSLSKIKAEASNALLILSQLEKVTSKKSDSGGILRLGSKEHSEAIAKVNSELSALMKNYQGWTAAEGGTSSKAYSDLGTAITDLNSLKNGLESGAMSANRFEAEFSRIRASASEASLSIKKAGEDFKLPEKMISGTQRYSDSIKKLDIAMSSISGNLKKWTAAKIGKSKDSYIGLERTRDAMEALKNSVKSGSMSFKDFSAQFSKLSSDAASYSANIKNAGEATKSTGDEVRGLASKFTTWLGISQIIMRAVVMMKQMVSETIAVDTAMTELRKVTSESDSAYDEFLKGAVDRVDKLGASLSDVITVTADFARLGYDIEEASELADTAIVYKNVADGIDDISEASSSIISTMKAFGIEAGDAMSIVDKFNEVSNNFAISSEGIGEALKRSASALHVAGSDIDESIALITAANTVVQNPETVGTSMKVISMYLRASKAEAEKAGESTEGMAESVSKLRDRILELTENKVDIQIDEDTFDTPYRILQKISKIWDDLKDPEQSELMQLIGGKRNANVIAALLENFDVAEEALRTSKEAEGSALRENEKYLESIQGHIERFKGAFQELSTNLFTSDIVKDFVSIGTAIVKATSGILSLTSALGGMRNVLFSIAGILAVKNLDKINSVISSVIGSVSALGPKIANISSSFNRGFLVSINKGAGKAQATLSGLSAAFASVGISASTAQIAVGSFVAALSLMAIAVKSIEKAEEKARQDRLDSIYNAREAVSEADSLKDLYVEYERTNAQLDGTIAAKEAATAASDALAEALRAEGAAAEGASGSLKDLTLQELKKAVIDADKAVSDASKNMNIAFTRTRNELSTLDRMAVSSAVPGELANRFLIEKDDVAQAKIALEMYDLIVARQQELYDAGGKDTDEFKAISSFLNDIYEDADNLKDAYSALEKANGLVSEASSASAKEMARASGDASESISEMTDEFGVLKDSIDSAASSYDNLKNKLKEKSDYDTGYENRVKSFKEFEALIKEGKFGTKEFQAYSDYFGLLGQSSEDIKKWALANKKYYTDTAQGANAFLREIQRLNWSGDLGKDVASYDSITGDFKYDINRLEELADAVGMTKEAVQDMLGELRSYSENWVERTPVETITELLNAGVFKESVSGITTTMESMMSYTGMAADQVSALVAELNTFRQEAGLSPIEIAPPVVDVDPAVSKIEGVGDTEASATVDVVAETANAQSQIDALISNNNGRSINLSVGTRLGGFRLFANGVSGAKKGPAILGDERSITGEPKPEMVISKGEAYIAGLDGPELVNLNSGDTVLTNTQTKKALGGSYRGGRRSFPAFASGIPGVLGGILGGISTAIAKTKDQIAEEILADMKKPSNIFKKPASLVGQERSGGTVRPGSGGGGGGSGGGGSSGGSSGSGSNDDKEFEKQYKYHQHLLKMDKESMEEYLNWLKDAYEEAYEKNEITLDEYRKYKEEVYKGFHDLFLDSLEDSEKEIEALEKDNTKMGDIINIYNNLIQKVKSEIRSALKSGVDESSDYIESLKDKITEYEDEIADIRDDAKDDAKDSLDDLIDYRIDMLKQELQNEKDALSERLSDLKDFYGKQKDMLRDQYDEEKYLDEQREKRKAKADIEAEIESLRFDDSAWAQKRKLELQEELAGASKDLETFEKDKALENTEKFLDSMYEKQEESIQKEIDAIDEKLNDPEALYNKALSDIRNNTKELYDEMVKYNNKYGSGNPEDIKNMWEESYIAFEKYLDVYGKPYKDIILKNVTGVSQDRVGKDDPSKPKTAHKVAKYKSKSTGLTYAVQDDFGIGYIPSSVAEAISDGSSVIVPLSTSAPSSKDSISGKGMVVYLSSGDIVINGSASTETVSQIRRAQRDNLNAVLREFNRLGK